MWSLALRLVISVLYQLDSLYLTFLFFIVVSVYTILSQLSDTE